MARAGPVSWWRWRLGPARFGSYFGVLQYLPHEWHTTLPASEDVTAVTDSSSSTPLFFGRDRPGFQKMQVVVQKKQDQIVLELCYVSNRGPMGSGCLKARHPNT